MVLEMTAMQSTDCLINTYVRGKRTQGEGGHGQQTHAHDHHEDEDEEDEEDGVEHYNPVILIRDKSLLDVLKHPKSVKH